MKKKRIVYITVFVLVIVGVIALYKYNSYVENKIYSDYSVEYTMETDRDIKSRYYDYADGALCFTDDGMSYIKNGREVWNQGFEIKNPVMDICGGYVAIGELKSNKVHLYDINGEASEIKLKYPLINVEVSEQGVVAAVLEDSKANYFQITDKSGKELVTGRTVLKGNGYPVDFSLSQDGQKMIVSYIYVSGGISQSKVLFYNFSEIGQNSTDRMVGGFNQYTSTIVPDVEFINNNTAVAFGDDKLTVYKMKEKPSIKEEIELDEKIQSIFYSEKYIGIVFRNDDKEKARVLKVYNTSGKQIFSKDIDSEYSEIVFAGNHVLKYNDKKCELISLKDVVKYEKTFDVAVEKMIPVEGHMRYMMILPGKVEGIELK